MPLWASQGKARKIPDFSIAFMLFPWFCHRSVTPGRYPNPHETGALAPDSRRRMVMIVAMRGWWQQFQDRRRHRQDIVAFCRLMDAREARRAAH